MICQAFLPAPALQAFVQGYQLRHFRFAEAMKIPFKPYAPRPEQTLVFYPRGYEVTEYVRSHTFVKRPSACIMGQFTERTNRHPGSSDFLVILVNFYPGVLYRITGLPYDELTNTCIDAEGVFSTEVKLVSERLNSADYYIEMISIIERFLLKLVKNIKREPHPVDIVSGLITGCPEQTSVIQMAQSSCLSTRQFERKFKERIGISPKLYTRIARLTKAFRLKYHQPELDWLSIALWSGYEDYQHLAKDFQALAGSSPGYYLLEDHKAPERFFGLQDSSL